MNPHVKKVLIIAVVAVGAFIAYEIYRAIAAGVNTVAGFFNWFSNAGSSAIGAVTDAVSTVAGNVTAAASIPSLTATSQNLDTTITNANDTDYAPGGRIYNEIQASQGQAAADASWANVQADDANMTSQTGTGAGNLLSSLF